MGLDNYYVVPHNRPAGDYLDDFLATKEADTDDLRAIIDASKFGVFKEWFDRNFPNGGHNTLWNPPTIRAPKQNLFATNDNIIHGAELETRRLDLIKKSKMIRDISGTKPYNLFDVYDDTKLLTNMLRDGMEEVFEKDFGDLVNTRFRANFSTTTRSRRTMEDHIDRFLSAPLGPISAVGGTFSDVDDKRGKLFQEKLMPKLFEGYVLGLCWGQQVGIRTYSTMSEIDTFVLNGALKSGIFPVNILNAGPFHGMFTNSDKYQSIMSLFLHTDHVVVLDELKKLGDVVMKHSGDTNGYLRVIAWDQILNRACGYMTENGKAALLAFHPEVPFAGGTNEKPTPKVEAIKDFQRSRTAKTLNQYEFGEGEEEGNLVLPGRVKRDPGKAMLISVFDYFASDYLRKHGKKST